MLKKTLIGVTTLFVLMVCALIAVPFFYDVNKLKPEITGAIEESLNVRAEIGNLSLNLFGGVNIGIETLKLTETVSQNVLFEMNNATLRIPYLAALTGKLSVTLLADKPQVSVIKYKDGTMNVSKLLKNKPKEPSEAQTQKTDEASSAGGAAALGASRVSFSTDVTNAFIAFKDLQTGFDYKIENLNVMLDDVGVNRAFKYDVSTNLSIDNKKDLVLKGKALIFGNAEIEMSGEGFQALTLDSQVDLTGLDVKMAGLLNKTKEIPLKIAAKLRTTPQDVNIEKIELIAGDFKVLTRGKVDNLNNPTLNMSIASSDLDLKNWKDIIAPLKAFDMLGKLSFDLKIQGTAAKPELEGKFEFKGGSLKLAALTQRITELNMVALFSGNRMTFKNTGLKIGESDMKLSGYIENFSEPKVDLELNSALINLDKMLPAPPKSEDKKSNQTAAKDDETSVNKNADPFAEIRKNPTLQKLDLSVSANISKLISKNIQITEMKADILMKNLVFTLKNASLNIFNGSADAFLQMDIKDVPASYQMNANLKGVDINQAVVSQAKNMDKYVTGLANGNIIVSGAGTQMGHLKKNLKGSGKFFVKNGTWLAADSFKNIGDKLSKVPKVGDKLKNVKVTDKFKELKVDFVLGSGALTLQKAIVDMEEAKTAIDAAGVIDFDQNMKLEGNILAPISDIPKDLRAADGRGKIPFELRGKATSPELEWEKTLRKVGTAYAKDEGKKLIKEGAESLIKDKNVKKLFEKFKF